MLKKLTVKTAVIACKRVNKRKNQESDLRQRSIHPFSHIIKSG